MTDLFSAAHYVQAWVRNDDGRIIGWLCTCGTMNCDEVNR